MVEISVVIPVYGCRGCLHELHRRLRETLDAMDVTSEIVFVDDRSPDASWAVVREIAAADSAVRGVRLSRNFGQHAAITAGLTQSVGRWTVVMDCDLQDPPEEIPRLYEKATSGYDIVLTRRTARRQSVFRRMAGRAYFKLRNVFLNLDIDSEHATLSMLSRKVVDAFLSLRDKDRQYILILEWLGFQQITIDLEPAHRYEGQSSYTLSRLIRVALDGVFFQTTTLLRWIVYAGFLVASAGLALAAVILVSYFAVDPLPGWTSLIVLFLLLTGFIITSTGVTGLYVGKIFEQVKGRPLFVVDELAEPVEVTDSLVAPELDERVSSSP